MPVDNPNVGIAFGLVIGAGLSTALGAAVVFFPSLVKLASRRVLAGALGISAGVMTYVSFVEIFNKSQSSFQDAGFEEDQAYVYATLCFFGGVFAMLLMDMGVKMLSGGHHHHHHDDHGSGDLQEREREEGEVEGEAHLGTPACCSPDPVGDLETIQRQTAELAEREREREREDHKQDSPMYSPSEVVEEGEQQLQLQQQTSSPVVEKKGGKGDSSNGDSDKLVRMGVNTALAIGLHNFPEGLATFVASLDDPSVGAVLAIAIGIHNIPEGLCVALPIYYATGNRWKAFAWAMVSGASEPIAALLGWAILANSFSDTLYAVLFGLVGGMMVMISTRELIPTAHRYDPDDTVVTYSFIVGMVIMALSLVLFVL
eukprot:CAMPEP_0116545978 /NCGR_PEP_ID=MMETSP0397-20121206/2974_1 /TAXON_ID=216820 /ORGANISM="Cyclophora tenuis, Strain ECT3854" /LENGTH=371 /DNA_ID=CAMNT_0004070363 /DNA_START=38 /DNA_END=1153 /DNA_ORIENTATION=-